MCKYANESIKYWVENFRGIYRCKKAEPAQTTGELWLRKTLGVPKFDDFFIIFIVNKDKSCLTAVSSLSQAMAGPARSNTVDGHGTSPNIIFRTLLNVLTYFIVIKASVRH